MLYYLGSVNCFGAPENPRISAIVRRVSTNTHLGNVIVWSGTTHLELPKEAQPRAWLREALEDWLWLQER